MVSDIIPQEKGVPVVGEVMNKLLNILPFLVLCAALTFMTFFRTRRAARSLASSTAQLTEMLTPKPEVTGSEKPATVFFLTGIPREATV